MESILKNSLTKLGKQFKETKCSENLKKQQLNQVRCYKILDFSIE